ncbi:MAG: hypothetical protein IJT43_09675 [Stomatobaculum sp.]|nr:hypothetical protein [Stomatobaculum sp.]
MERRKRTAAGILAAMILLIGSCLPVYAAAPTDYSYLTSAYRARMPYAESQKDDNGRSLSTLIDHGDYYELTNVNLYAYKKYAADEVENVSVGDRFTVEGKAYKLVSIGEDGERVLERKNAFETEYAYLKPVDPGRNKQGYYISVRKNLEDGSRDSADIYYGGSVFLKKDCAVQSLGLTEDGSRNTVSADTYLTADKGSLQPEGAFLYGYDEAEGLRTLCGYFTLDAGGYFETFTEKY